MDNQPSIRNPIKTGIFETNFFFVKESIKGKLKKKNVDIIH